MRYRLKGSTNEDIIKVICENRNMTEEDLKAFLNPSKDNISNPMSFINMDEAVRLFASHIKSNSNILVLVDSDADGYCSAATLINYIKVVFPNINIDYVLHEDKAHGLTEDVMTKIIDKKPGLVIIPDASSGDVKQHKILKDLNIDVIVLDHHDFDELSTNAIVVTNQIGEVNNTLSGGGMVIKFLEQIDKYLNLGQSEYYYDLVGASLVADSMKMSQSETRYYVTQGLNNINNPLLKALMGGADDKNFNTISFNIAPTINAFIRVGTMEEKEDLFKALIGVEEERTINIRGKGELTLPLNQYIATLSNRIKSRQNNEIKKALEHENIMIHNDGAVVVAVLDKDTRRSLTGLIGNKLANQYNKPAIVLIERKDGMFAGSGRSISTFEDLKGYINDTKTTEFCDGHAGAFGIGFKSNAHLGEFLCKTIENGLGEDADVFVVDKAYPNGASAYDIIAVDELRNHWCRGFERPLFYIKLENVLPSECNVIGKKNDTISIKHDYINYIKFKCSEEEVDKFDIKGPVNMEIIGVFNVNEYKGFVNPQVEILHMEYKEVENQEVKEETPTFGFEEFVW